jgi:hypothetical protein
MSARTMVYGALAGAAGTTILDVAGYADMAIRGRPASELPAKVVKDLARRAGIEPYNRPDDQLSDRDKNRETAFGALIGYADGLASGAMYGAIRPAMRGVSWFWTGIALAIATGLLSEGTATALKQTDPRKWGVAGWIGDVVPRCLYGWVTAVTFDALAKDQA